MRMRNVNTQPENSQVNHFQTRDRGFLIWDFSSNEITSGCLIRRPTMRKASSHSKSTLSSRRAERQVTRGTSTLSMN